MQHHRRAAHAGRREAVPLDRKLHQKPRWGNRPSDYAITAYDAALVGIAAITTVAKSGAPVTAAAVRDAIQAGKVDTLQGTLS